MQKLVNEFRDYARLPAAQMKPLDLNPLVPKCWRCTARRWTTACCTSAQLEPGPAAHPGRRHAAAAGHPQPGAERAGRGGRPARRPGRAQHPAARGEHGELRAVRLTVIDNGPGFADKVLKRAFEPYVTTKAKGTGLGLAVVKKIADEHGARCGWPTCMPATSPRAR
jgi:nitrogen fixation/metabolism regulation signal transduction histidine kinase